MNGRPSSTVSRRQAWGRRGGHSSPVRAAPSCLLVVLLASPQPAEGQARRAPLFAAPSGAEALPRLPAPLEIPQARERRAPTVLSGMATGLLIGAVGAPVTGLFGEASPAAMAAVGGGAGLVAGGSVAALGRRHAMNVGRGAAIGFLPGAVVGAALGGATFSHEAAPIVWGLILGVPTAVAGGVVGGRFPRPP